MKVYREMYPATVESGVLTPGRYDGEDTLMLTLPARLELEDRHMWLYDEEGGKLRVEFERRNASAELGFATTEELITELHARMEVSRTIGEPMRLDYRTVDS